MTTEQLAKNLLAIIDSEMYVNDFGGLETGRDATTDILAAIYKLEKALAQPEQEPVESCNGMPAYEGPLSKTQRKQLTQELNAPLTLNGVALYPQSEWVGLTDEEVRECYAHVEGVTVSEAVILMSVVRITQAKLKEKQ